MDTQAQNHTRVVTPDKSPRLLYLVAAIAIILFGLVGIAAFMGWLPNSTAHSDAADTAVLDKKNQDRQAFDKKQATEKQSFERQSNATSKSTAPSKPATSSVAVPSPVAQAAKCQGCGEIASVREVVTKAKGSGFGAAGGAVVGGVLGNQVGEGKGKDVATVAGVIGGAVAGNEIERRTRSTKSYEVTVRLDDGTTEVINETSQHLWRTGDRVKVVDGVIQARS